MGKQKFDITVEVSHPLQETNVAMYLLGKLLKENNIDLNLCIAYDFECEGLGYYLPNADGLAHTIFVNPLKCKRKEQVIDGDCDEIFSHGYVQDFSVFGVTIHEFCHLLQFAVFEDIEEEYAKAFPEERFYLNDYCNNDLLDELAEVMSLYITNPYLLKMISKPHWQFCKRYFKSPVACSLLRSRQIFHSFPIVVKKQLKDKWKIIYNEYDQKFVRV